VGQTPEQRMGALFVGLAFKGLIAKGSHMEEACDQMMDGVGDDELAGSGVPDGICLDADNAVW
jgi:hypothetical protein